MSYARRDRRILNSDLGQFFTVKLNTLQSICFSTVYLPDYFEADFTSPQVVESLPLASTEASWVRLSYITDCRSASDKALVNKPTSSIKPVTATLPGLAPIQRLSLPFLASLLGEYYKPGAKYFSSGRVGHRVHQVV
jgi:hypothetical protein